jgi:hypothetical protein
MAGKDEAMTPDGMWMATMGAFEQNLFFYKAIGTKVDVFHKEPRRSGPFGWWGPLVDTWVPGNADEIRITNNYFGSTAREAEALGLGICPPAGTQSSPRPSLDCRLQAWGIGGSWTYDKPAGLSGPIAGLPSNPTPTPGATLDVRAVRGRGSVRIGTEVLTLLVDSGLPPWETGGEALTSAPPVLNVGDRIAAVHVSSDTRITEVGGVRPDGSAWRLPLDAAIAVTEIGHEFYVERPVGDRVAVEIAVSASGREYLKTEADGDAPNNLLALPRF